MVGGLLGKAEWGGGSAQQCERQLAGSVSPLAGCGHRPMWISFAAATFESLGCGFVMFFPLLSAG